MIYVTSEFARVPPLSGMLPGTALEIVCHCASEWGIRLGGEDLYALAVADVDGVNHILPKDEEIKWGRFRMILIKRAV